jgi:hypothetical protein
MRKYFFLFAIALSTVFVSCNKDSKVVKPSPVIKSAQGKFISVREKLAKSINATRHLTMPLTVLETQLNVPTKGKNLDYMNKYLKYYKDYSYTKGKLNITSKKDHLNVEVDYGNGTIEYGNHKVKGKFIIDVKRDKEILTEKRIWNLEVDGNKVNGIATYKISKERGVTLYEGECKDFKLVTKEGETITEDFKSIEKYNRGRSDQYEGDYIAKSSKGVDCKYSIKRPLVYDLTYSLGLPIDGEEEVEIKEGDKKLKMIVDYGTGEKDMKVKITYPDGEVEIIDFAKKKRR